MNLNLQHVRRSALLSALLLFSAASVVAQGGSIQGRITLPSGAPLDGAIKISLQNLRGIKATTFTDNDGRF